MVYFVRGVKPPLFISASPTRHMRENSLTFPNLFAATGCITNNIRKMFFIEFLVLQFYCIFHCEVLYKLVMGVRIIMQRLFTPIIFVEKDFQNNRHRELK